MMDMEGYEYAIGIMLNCHDAKILAIIMIIKYCRVGFHYQVRIYFLLLLTDLYLPFGLFES